MQTFFVVSRLLEIPWGHRDGRKKIFLSFMNYESKNIICEIQINAYELKLIFSNHFWENKQRNSCFRSQFLQLNYISLQLHDYIISKLDYCKQKAIEALCIFFFDSSLLQYFLPEGMKLFFATDIIQEIKFCMGEFILFDTFLHCLFVFSTLILNYTVVLYYLCHKIDNIMSSVVLFHTDYFTNRFYFWIEK